IRATRTALTRSEKPDQRGLRRHRVGVAQIEATRHPPALQRAGQVQDEGVHHSAAAATVDAAASTWATSVPSADASTSVRFTTTDAVGDATIFPTRAA